MGEIAERTRRIAGAPEAPIRAFPWLAVQALSPFVRLFREMAEMRYLWRLPAQLDNARRRAQLGEGPHTDVDLALRRTLEGLGRLGAGEAKSHAATKPLRANRLD